MKVAIIGLPKSGKTTIFNTLTKGKAEVAAYSPSLTPNIGIARVPDSRLNALAKLFNPRKITPAEVNYVDIGGSLKSVNSKGEMAGELLNYLTTADALLQVVRTFESNQIPLPEGGIDADRDLSTLDMELAFSDLAIIERRLNKLGSELKGAKTTERESYLKEQSLLKKVKTDLDHDIPIRGQNLDQNELKALAHYQFLTAKPVLVILNIGEDQLPQSATIEKQVKQSHPEFAVIAICGKLEMELSQLDDSSAREFRDTMELPEPALDRVIKSSYSLLGLHSFFTTGSDEVKAWTITENTSAPQAAGKVHSDIERGFIRAEVLSYADFERCGNMSEARKKGLLRTEGKSYIVQDGDIINYLFNI
jgi:ribosome-binding ATPase